MFSVWSALGCCDNPPELARLSLAIKHPSSTVALFQRVAVSLAPERNKWNDNTSEVVRSAKEESVCEWEGVHPRSSVS
jgi:hypothetical protein